MKPPLWLQSHAVPSVKGAEAHCVCHRHLTESLSLCPRSGGLRGSSPREGPSQCRAHVSRSRAATSPPHAQTERAGQPPPPAPLPHLQPLQRTLWAKERARTFLASPGQTPSVANGLPSPQGNGGWEVPSDGAGPGVSALGAEQRPPCRPLTPPPSSGQHLAPTSSRPQAPGPTACSLGPCHSVPRWAEVRVHLLLSGLSYPSTQSTRPSASSQMRPLKPSSTHPDRPRAP